MYDEWQRILDITYNVVEEQLGNHRSFDETLAKTLKVSGLYVVSEKQGEYIQKYGFKCVIQNFIPILHFEGLVKKRKQQSGSFLQGMLLD